jgi:hypothetical protein
MAFVNEYVPDEDIKPYGLEAYWNSLLKRGRPASYRLEWTIDRDRDIYLMLTHIANQAFEEGDWVEFTLWWEGKVFKCRLKYASSTSEKLSDNPFIQAWDLISINPVDEISHEQVLAMLKEALTVYGYSGVRKQLPNTVVEFNF